MRTAPVPAATFTATRGFGVRMAPAAATVALAGSDVVALAAATLGPERV